MWIEYEGVATIGFDMTDIEITVSDDTVSITMPDAKLLGKKVVESTLNETSYISSSDGFFFKNKITAEDQRDAVKKGQKEIIKAHADEYDNGSVNAFIQRAICETMERDNAKSES
jgi:hypothetical protein